MPKRSYLEGRNYQTLQNAAASSFIDGTFQSAFDQFIADSIPSRDDVLLSYAALQRKLIETANLSFGYSTYHTKYNSDYIFDATTGAIAEYPWSQTQLGAPQLADAAEAVNQLTSLFPTIRWRMALPDRSSTSTTNPANSYIANAADSEWITRRYLQLLNTEIEVIDLSSEDCAEHLAEYFKTDHHWNIHGAYSAYRSIVASLGWSPVQAKKYYTVYTDQFIGSEARNGLLVTERDELEDIQYDRSALSLNVSGEPKPLSWLDSDLGEPKQVEQRTERFENLYAKQFHGDPDFFSIVNDDAEGSRSLLIIGDSFTNPIERLFAEHYKNTYVIDPRYYDGSLADFIRDHNIDDAIFLWSANTFSSNVALQCIRS